MIAFDTNYLVRHIVQDDPDQCRTVAEAVKEESGNERTIRIFDLVLLETHWVLRSVYGFDRRAWSEVLEALLDDSIFCFDDSTGLRWVLEHYRKGNADFADYMLLNFSRSERLKLKTFDIRLQKELPLN